MPLLQGIEIGGRQQFLLVSHIDHRLKVGERDDGQFGPFQRLGSLRAGPPVPRTIPPASLTVFMHFMQLLPVES